MNHENSLENAYTLNKLVFIETGLTKYMHQVVLIACSKLWQNSPLVASAAPLPAEGHSGGQAPITKGNRKKRQRGCVFTQHSPQPGSQKSERPRWTYKYITGLFLTC